MAALTYPDLAAFLDAQYRPTGHRLGILVAALTAPPNANVECGGAQIATTLQSGVRRRAVEAAARAIERHRLSSERRMCCLQPRPGEPAVRAADVVDFLVRYGHEYSVVLIDVDDTEVLAASAAAGCEAHIITSGEQ